jgi:hypothetical protein
VRTESTTIQGIEFDENVSDFYTKNSFVVDKAYRKEFIRQNTAIPATVMQRLDLAFDPVMGPNEKCRGFQRQ